MTKQTLKKLLVSLAVLASLAGCKEADVVSQNISAASDSFEVTRRIVFYNGITGEYAFVIQGLCSLGNDDTAHKRTIVCKTGPGKYKKHFLGLSDNMTYFVEQIDDNKADPFHYRVILKPSAMIPQIDVQ